MQKAARITLFFSSFLLLAVFFPSCAKPETIQNGITFQYASYLDIPGITSDEITAIEALQKQKDFFVYGITPTTEAFIAQDNTIRGYSTLFCELLSNLIGISFKPVLYEWGDLIAGLESGEIDFTGDLSPTDERRKTYLMTSAIAQRTIKFIRLKNSPPISEISASRPLRLVFFYGSITYNNVKASGVFDTFDAFFVRDTEAAYKLLESGRADAVLTENVLEAAFDSYGEVTSEDFFPMIYSPVSLATKNPSLESIISVVQKALQNNGLRYLTFLYRQGQREYLKHKLDMRLGEEERAYIQANPVVLFAAESDNYPISFYNTREHLWQGVAFDVLAEIQALTGISFEVANGPDTDWADILKMLEDRKVSMVSELIWSEDRKERFLWPASNFMTDFYGLFSKAEFPDISTGEILYARVGLSRGTAHADLFHNWFPDHEYITEYENINAAFDALNRGEIDLVMSSQHSFLTLTNFRELPGYKINIAFDLNFESTFGFNKNEAVLCSIVDRALSMVDTNGISGHWTRKTFDYRVKLVQARMPWLVGSSALFLTALVLVALLFARNRIATQQLEIQSEAVLAASKAKGTFLAHMSHEIRTPLNAIIGMAYILKDCVADNEKAMRGVNQIMTSSHHLLGILNDILDMSKIESGKLEITHEPFSLVSACEEVSDIMMHRCIEKRLTFTTNLHEIKDIILTGDKLRLNQVLINLLGNSVKFTGTNGEIKFIVEILDSTGEKASVKFTVSDNGIGMSEEQIKRLFIPFEQANSSIAARFGGTGLGLSLSQNFIKMMGGEICVKSELHKGSSFEFVLIFEKNEIQIQDRAAQEEKHDVNFSGKRMLLAEDIEINRLIIRELLSLSGIAIDEAEDGKKAVEIFYSSARGFYDIIMMDIQMPVMDGYEASKAIRALDRPDAKTIPIVAMTANAYNEDVEHALSAGMNSHLSKPVDKPALIRTIEKILNGEKA